MHPFQHLEFIKVLWNELIINKKCLIVHNEVNSICVYYGTFYRVGRVMAHSRYIHLKNATATLKYNNNDIVCIYENTHIFHPDNNEYFILVPKKQIIQSAMEARAINKILQQIIGDANFIYI